MDILKLIDKVLVKVEGWLIFGFLSVMVTFTFIQVCLRGLYTHAHFRWANMLMGYLDWSEPLVRLLVLWLTFLGASLLTGDNKHVKIDLFSNLLPQKLRPWRELILAVVCIIVSATMVFVCIGYVKLEMEFGGTVFLRLPNWIGQLILPLGFAMILFRFLLRAVDQGFRISRGTKK
ncbi:MAG: TRAP transporter small permease subunit [Desulfatiglandaceae bacterium]